MIQQTQLLPTKRLVAKSGQFRSQCSIQCLCSPAYDYIRQRQERILPSRCSKPLWLSL